MSYWADRQEQLKQTAEKDETALKKMCIRDRLEALIGKNRERYGKLDHTQPEQAKKVVLQFLRSF